MENHQRLGPIPARGSGPASSLSAQRAAVLERLQDRQEPQTPAEVGASLGLHPNTAREHLEALVDRHLAVRERATRRGRGRPPWTYRPAARTEPDSRVREYAGLATALASHISRTSRDPAADALEAGRSWGRELAEGATEARPDSSAPDARRRVVALIDELGFDPQTDDTATTVALRRCPLLDAAARYPEVICAVHLGLVRGAMDVYGGDPDRTDLRPFAEPGACRLELLTGA